MVDLWHITEINWLRELSPGNAQKLRNSAAILQYDSGQLVFEPEPEPQFVYILESGLVRTYRVCARGEEVTFGFIQPGEVFGELAVFSDKPRESHAIAVERSSVIKLNREVFSEVIRSHPSIVFSIAAQIEDRFKQIESRVEDLVFRDARSRLASMILQLSDEFGKTQDDKLLVDIRLTHAEIATLIGTSRPTVSIALGEFEDENIITRSNGKIVILDKDVLREEVDRTG